jgi:hypothetical protein
VLGTGVLNLALQATNQFHKVLILFKVPETGVGQASATIDQCYFLGKGFIICMSHYRLLAFNYAFYKSLKISIR